MEFVKILASDFKVELNMNDNNLDAWTYKIFQNNLPNVQPMYENKKEKILPVILIELLDRIDYHYDVWGITIKEKIKFIEAMLKDINFYAGRNSCVDWIKQCKNEVPYKKEDFIYGYCAVNKNIVFHQMCLITSMYDKVGEGWYQINEKFESAE